MKELPIFETDVINKTTVRFKCPHCKRYHYHCRGDGPRVAHCDSTSPYDVDGYIIKEKIKISPGKDLKDETTTNT